MIVEEIFESEASWMLSIRATASSGFDKRSGFYETRLIMRLRELIIVSEDRALAIDLEII